MTPLILLVAALNLPSSGEDPGLTALEQYRWKNRLLLIFAPQADDRRYLEQRLFLSQVDKSDLIERELLIFTCFTDHGFVERWTSRAEEQSFERGDADTLRETLGVANDTFQVSLIGKDGGEKRRSHSPITFEALMKQIDSMPMRQQEMNGATE